MACACFVIQVKGEWTSNGHVTRVPLGRRTQGLQEIKPLVLLLVSTLGVQKNTGDDESFRLSTNLPVPKISVVLYNFINSSG